MENKYYVIFDSQNLICKLFWITSLALEDTHFETKERSKEVSKSQK